MLKLPDSFVKYKYSIFIPIINLHDLSSLPNLIILMLHLLTIE